MKDGIIKGDGTSRKMKATLPATYEEFKQAAGAGEQTLDVMFNAPGWQQQPTFLNKQNLGQDKTMAVYNRGPEGTVDDLFQSVFAVGDIKVSTRTDLGDSWLLCNGDTFLPEEYPALAKTCSKKAVAWKEADINSPNPGGEITAYTFGAGYWFLTQYTSDGYKTFYSENYNGPWNEASVGNFRMDLTEVFHLNGKYYADALTSGAYYTPIYYADSPAGPWEKSDPIFSGSDLREVWNVFASDNKLFVSGTSNTYGSLILWSSTPEDKSSWSGYEARNGLNAPLAVSDGSNVVMATNSPSALGQTYYSTNINDPSPTFTRRGEMLAGKVSAGWLRGYPTLKLAKSLPEDGQIVATNIEKPGKAIEFGDFIIISGYDGSVTVLDKSTYENYGFVALEAPKSQLSFAVTDGNVVARLYSSGKILFATPLTLTQGLLPTIDIPGVYAYIRGK